MEMPSALTYCNCPWSRTKLDLNYCPGHTFLLCWEFFGLCKPSQSEWIQSQYLECSCIHTWPKWLDMWEVYIKDCRSLYIAYCSNALKFHCRSLHTQPSKSPLLSFNGKTYASSNVDGNLLPLHLEFRTLLPNGLLIYARNEAEVSV